MAVCFRRRLGSFGTIVPAIKNGVLYDCLDGVYLLKGLVDRRRGSREAGKQKAGKIFTADRRERPKNSRLASGFALRTTPRQGARKLQTTKKIKNNTHFIKIFIAPVKCTALISNKIFNPDEIRATKISLGRLGRRGRPRLN